MSRSTMNNSSPHQKRRRPRCAYQLASCAIVSLLCCHHPSSCCDAADGRVVSALPKHQHQHQHQHHDHTSKSVYHRRQWTGSEPSPSFLGGKFINSFSRSGLKLRGGGNININNIVNGAGWNCGIHDVRGGGANNNDVAVSSDKKEAADASSSSTSPNQQSPFEYIPITALDDYGQSTQLRHAMESATRFGTPVLACICCRDGDEHDEQRIENAIVVCSLQRPRLGVVSPSPTTTTIGASTSSSSNNKKAVHSSIQGMVKLVATRDDIDIRTTTPSQNSNDDIPKHALHTAIVTTGLQSDANFLLNQLQTHISKYWFRYDTLPSTSSTSTMTVIKMVRDILLDCLGYDWSEEVTSGKVSGGIGSAAPSYDEQEDDEGAQRAGRPLGVCTFLLGLDSTSTTTHPFLTVIEANGASQQYVAHAMGACSQLANDKLSQQWKRCMSEKEAKAMMGEILKDIAKERGWITDENDDDSTGRNNDISGLTMVCETVTSEGIDVDFSPL